jgi:formylglycine-generating enzyme required for sulfatase activity
MLTIDRRVQPSDTRSGQPQLDGGRRVAAGMTCVAGGTFQMGSAAFYPEERPVHAVTVGGFWIDQCAVTNEEFARFVDATGYVTIAERPPRRRLSRCAAGEPRRWFDGLPEATGAGRSP